MVLPALDLINRSKSIDPKEIKMTPCSPRLISWQQFSAPNRSPRGTSNQEDMLKKKLQKEETMLQNDIEEVRLYQKDSDQRRKLEQKIEMRKNLINAMKNTIEVQENVVLNSGFIKVKRSISDDYTKYWCVLNYPTIKLYASERDCFPKQYLNIEKATNIITDDFCFSLPIEKETLYFMTASKEECDQWTKAISHIAGISIGYSSCVPVKPKRAGITRSLTLETYITGDQIKGYVDADCDNFDVIKGSFSKDVQVEVIDGKAFLKSGTLEDIVKWGIINCKSSRSKPSAAIFLCKHWVCSPDTFVDVVVNVWKQWEANGFPIGNPRNMLSERLANFVIQYIESPIVGTSQWSAKKGSKLYQNETVARRQCQKEVAQLHQYFATSLRRAQVKSRTIAVGIKKKKQSFIDKDEAKLIKNPINYTVKELATQLTLIQAELFDNISLDELMDKNWEHSERCPKLTEFINHTNMINSWVMDTILNGEDAKDQLNRYIKFIKIAYQLHTLNNFNSCLSILGGLESAPISRLRHIMSLPDNIQAKFDKIKNLYSPLNGYKNYRSFSGHEQSIPIIGVYLRDLTLAYDGNSKYMDEDETIINFDRMTLVAERVLELNEFNTSSFMEEITLMPLLHNRLKQIVTLSYNELYKKSTILQPPKVTKTPEQQLEEIQAKFDEYKANSKKQLDSLQAQLHNVDSMFSSFKAKKESKFTSKTKKEINDIKTQILNTLLMCDDFILEAEKD